ncbi:hypothetical protein H4S08_000131 [Coemansia sp. RSA 1365]|nr:hypothetical protein H4S08_000131 [Coemansia sp. RSA 1365]
MNSEYSTPARSQQHSPVPLTSQQLSSVYADVQLATPATYGLASHSASLDLPAAGIEVSNPQFAYLKSVYPPRPFSPSSVDFANMNIASGYPTPHSATPVTMQSQQSMQSHPQCAPLDTVSAGAVGTSNIASAQQPSADKPDFSYASLIAQSLVEAPMQRRTLNGIYEWIQEYFPYYRTRQNWQNSIRHNLSLNKGFMKIKRDEAHPGKGSFWTFTPGYESCLNGGHFKPIRSRSGRAALAAAAAMAAAKNSSANGNSDSEARNAPGASEATGDRPAKKAEKKTVRAIKSAKSLKRSHSVPPKENSAPPHQGASASSTAGAAIGEAGLTLPIVNMSDMFMPTSLAHSETDPAGIMADHCASKKMRVSSSQSHMGMVSLTTMVPHNVSIMSHPQTPSFAPSPSLMSATPMTMVNTAVHTPMSQPAQFQFHMPSPCSVPLPISAMDLASVPVPCDSNGPHSINGGFMGPPSTAFGDVASAGIDGATLFSDNANIGNDSFYSARRTPMQSRISWHGPESINHAFADMQQQQQMQMQYHQYSQHSSLGVTMPGESINMGLAMLGDGSGNLCMAGDSGANAPSVDWTMLANMPAPQTMSAGDMVVTTPHLHHMSSISTIDAQSNNGGPHNHYHHQPQQQQQRAEGAADVDPTVTGVSGSANGHGMVALYDEMLRDPSSIMNVFGQDLSGWQCTTKTNTIDPAALCAVDPESNTL